MSDIAARSGSSSPASFSSSSRLSCLYSCGSLPMCLSLVRMLVWKGCIELAGHVFVDRRGSAQRFLPDLSFNPLLGRCVSPARLLGLVHPSLPNHRRFSRLVRLLIGARLSACSTRTYGRICRHSLIRRRSRLRRRKCLGLRDGSACGSPYECPRLR